MECSFKWCKATTQLIIEQYKIKKNKFRDPKLKKKDVWMEILSVFQEKGYDISVDTLDRKFRNLKKTYTDIKDKNNRSGNGRTSWEHYPLFEEIFIEDRAVNSNVTIASMETAGNELDDVEDVAQNSPPFETGSRKRALKDYRQQSLEIERTKLAKMDQLIRDVEKNTQVQEERNNLLRQIIHLQGSSMCIDLLD